MMAGFYGVVLTDLGAGRDRLDCLCRRLGHGLQPRSQTPLR